MKRKYFSLGIALILAAAITGCNNNAPVQTQPRTDQSGYISMETAQAAALEAAQVSAENADISATELHEVAGVVCYKVMFTADNHAYSYSIDATTGAVIEAVYREQTAVPADNQIAVASADTQTATASAEIDKAKAQEIALAHAGVSASDATITKTKLDHEDGREVYDIEWYANGAKYDYEIATSNGEIISSGYESQAVVGTANAATVDEATAKQTALDRVPGATTADIYKWELDYDDGRPEYEGEIIYGGTEYDFTIDAATGTITDWDAETRTR